MAVSISKILDNSELSLKQFSEEAIKALPVGGIKYALN